MSVVYRVLIEVEAWDTEAEREVFDGSPVPVIQVAGEFATAEEARGFALEMSLYERGQQ